MPANRPVQPHDPSRGGGRGLAVRDARPDHAQREDPGFDRAILSDTVGFVSNLPTELVAAFRATLEEVAAADLILHVRDIAHPDSEAQAADVEAVLSSLGLAEEGSPPRLEVWNKLDLLPPAEREELLGEAARRNDVVALSALTGKGSTSFARRFPTCFTPALRPTMFASMPAMENGSPGCTRRG